MGTQFSFFTKDVGRMIGSNKARLLYIWFSRAFWGIFIYRVDRGFFLLIGKPYKFIRIIFIPLYNILQAYTNIDIFYTADIKGGLMVLHPSVGVVISGYAIIGENFTLTGGNVIGAKEGVKQGGIVIGNNCIMGANAAVIGPVRLANKIKIGALACVVKDCLQDGAILAGVPAKEL